MSGIFGNFFYKQTYTSNLINTIINDLSDPVTIKAIKNLGTFLLENAGKVGGGIGEILQKFTFTSLGGVVDAVRGLSFRYLFEIFPIFLGASAISFASNFAIKYIYKLASYNIGRPKLAIDQKMVSRFSLMPRFLKNIARKISGIFINTKDAPSAIFNKTISRKIQDITRDIENIRKNKGNLQNILLYGPPGTGKTMISKAIAEKSGMNYIMMSGGDLPQYIKRGEHVTEFNKLIDSVEKSNQPTIVFIDEADSLCQQREKLSQEMLELQNAFLNRTGTQSKKLMLVLATNRKNHLDNAILSRMDYKIEINKPAFAERVKIIRMYAEEFFSKDSVNKFFNPIRCRIIAFKTVGFSGRRIYKLMNTIYNRKFATKENKLSHHLIGNVTSEFITQERSQRKFSVITKMYHFIRDIFISLALLFSMPYLKIKGY